MAVTGAIRSAGTQLKVRISGTYTLVQDGRGGAGLGGESPEIEVTPIDETATRHYLVDLPNPGELTWRMNYVPGQTVQNYLLAAWKAGTKEAFQVIWSDGQITSFDAFVKNFVRTIEGGREVGADLTLKITGSITDP